MELFEGLVQIGRQVRYKILATDRSKKELGKLISRTKLDDLEAIVSVYDQGKVIIDCPSGRIRYDLRDGSLATAD